MTTFSKYLVQVDAADLPPSLRLDLRGLLQSFESVPPLRGESAVQSTVRKLSNEEAEALAARVVTLFGQVSRLSVPRPVEDAARGSGPGAADEATADVLPLFAAEA